jgi:DNA-binding transcriptional ArsR family regulator
VYNCATMHILTKPDVGTIFAALASPVRLEILAMLAGKELCVCEIAENLNRERSVVSRHLMMMEQAGILNSRSEGKRVIYWIKDKRALQLLGIGKDMVNNPVKG